MDAMTHAVEAYVATQRNPISDASALHAIRLIAGYLPVAVENGSDLVARGQMQVAALLAGWAFSNAMVGLVHAMAHSLGAICGTPHGLANALLLSHVMQFNLDEIPGLTADIGRAMGLDDGGMNDAELAIEAVAEMKRLTQKIGLPQKLNDLDIEQVHLEQAAELSLSDGSIIYNPKMIMEAEEVLNVYREAY
jgi:alcohol dehydrogenase